MVDLTARLDPAQQTLTASARAIRRHRTGFGGGQRRNGQAAADVRRPEHQPTRRTLVARPAGSQGGLVDAVRAAESALGQARTMLDAVDSAATDINRAVAALPVGDRRHPERHQQAARICWRRATSRAPTNSAPPGTRRSRRSSNAQNAGTADPLGAFTQLTKADAELDRLLASDHRGARGRRTAEPRVRPGAVHRAVAGAGGVGLHRHPPRQHRPRGAHPAGRGGPPAQAAQDKRATNLSEAIAHANGAAMLAAQAQIDGQRRRAATRSARTPAATAADGSGGNNMGAVLGGIIIGNILSGALRGGIGGSVGGGGAGRRRRSAARAAAGGGFSGGGGRVLARPASAP